MDTNTIALKMGFSVKGPPHVIMFDEEWNKIIQLPGYADRKQMKIFLDYVAEDTYKSTELQAYLQ